MDIGYIVDETAIQVDLFADNTQGFAYMKLVKGLHWSNDSRNSNSSFMTISINDSSWFNGTILLETEINQLTFKMHIFGTHLYRGTKWSHHYALKDYRTIGIQIGVGDRCSAYYNINVNETSSLMLPRNELVYPTKTTGTVSFYNTGGHFLQWIRYSVRCRCYWRKCWPALEGATTFTIRQDQISKRLYRVGLL